MGQGQVSDHRTGAEVGGSGWLWSWDKERPPPACQGSGRRVQEIIVPLCLSLHPGRPISSAALFSRVEGPGEQLVLIWTREATAFLVVCGQRAGMR